MNWNTVPRSTSSQMPDIEELTKTIKDLKAKIGPMHPVLMLRSNYEVLKRQLKDAPPADHVIDVMHVHPDPFGIPIEVFDTQEELNERAEQLMREAIKKHPFTPPLTQTADPDGEQFKEYGDADEN